MITIPARYEKVKYEDVPERIRERFRETAAGGKGLYIHGPVGTGKTHSAFAMKKRWDEINPTQLAIFWNTGELLADIRAEYDRQSYDKKHTLQKLTEVQSPLFIDDLGSEQATGWVLEQIYTLVNARYMNNLPTVFTSNLSVEQVGQALGDRIASRIVEMCEVIELTGDDKRLSI